MSDEKLSVVQDMIRCRVAEPHKHYRYDPIRLRKPEDLAFFANEVGTRLDWHEPGEQSLKALVFGRDFDNAGFWGEPTYEYYTNELHVVLYIQEYPVISVNLATLFAWATDQRRDWGLDK